MTLVLQSGPKKAEPPTRENILKRLNRAVVYQRGLDITAEIGKALNERGEQ